MTLLWRVLVLAAGTLVVAGSLFLLQGFFQLWSELSVHTPSTESWHIITPGVEERRFLHSPSGTQMIVYRINPREQQFHLAIKEEARFVSEWFDELSGASLVFNAAFFHEDFSPSGWVKRDGVRHSTRMFDPALSALWSIDPTLQLIDTSKHPPAFEDVITGLQSYPLLLNDGKRAVATESEKRARRTWIATGSDAHWYLGVVSSHEISLFALAYWLEAIDLPLVTALNLDGGPSTGVAYHDAPSSLNSLGPVPIVGWLEPR